MNEIFNVCHLAFKDYFMQIFPMVRFTWFILEAKIVHNFFNISYGILPIPRIILSSKAAIAWPYIWCTTQLRSWLYRVLCGMWHRCVDTTCQPKQFLNFRQKISFFIEPYLAPFGAAIYGFFVLFVKRFKNTHKTGVLKYLS